MMYNYASRPLLPASETPKEQSDPVSSVRLKRKRSHLTKVACNSCRAKRSACDGNRPTCSTCKSRGSECVYVSKDESETPTMALKRENETLRKNLETMEDLIRHLQHMPEEVARNTLQRLQTTSDPASVLQLIRGNTVGAQISEQETARGPLPLTYSGLEFELMVRHPTAYPTLDDNALAGSPLLRPQDLSHRTHFPRLYSSKTIQIGAIGASAAHRPEADLASPRLPAYSDLLLDQLDIAFWTSTSVTNKFAAEAISLYLETDHPILGLFDARLFLIDLVHHKSDFCSSFLVCSLLSFVSQAYAVRDSQALARSFEFECEAVGLWGLERTSDSLKNLAGLVLLLESMSGRGHVEKAATYVKHAIHMAMRMKLFGVTDSLSTSELCLLPKKDQRAIRFAAWGAFNVVSMHTLFYLAPATQYPPMIPVPEDPEEQDKNDDDATTSPSPSYFRIGQTFAAFCALWTIMSEFFIVYRQTEYPRTISLTFAMSQYQKLLTLADKLPNSMIWDHRPPDHALLFHMWYHVVVLDIFRPFISELSRHSIPSTNSSLSSAEAIFALSVRQLKRLVLLYSSQPFASYCIFGHPAFLYLANAVLKETRDPEWKFYFRLCLDGYLELSHSFSVCEEIVQGLLAMAVENGIISGLEVRSIINSFHGKFPRRRVLDRGNSGFMVDLDLAVTDKSAARVDLLASKFDEITAFETFTEGVL